MNNNAAKAAEAVADAVNSVKTVTNNQRVLARQICAAGTIVARVVGALLVSLGLIAFCAFGMVYSKLKSEVAVTPAAEAQSHNPVVTEQTTAETV